MEDRSRTRIAILDGPACMGAAILHDGSRECRHLGSGRGGGLRVLFGLWAVGCGYGGTAPVRVSVQLVPTGRALVLKVVDWGPRVTI